MTLKISTDIFLKSSRWIFRKSWKKRLLFEVCSFSGAQQATFYLSLGFMVV